MKAGLVRMKILVTGASGLVGSAVVAHALAKGHDVVKVSRTEGEGVVWWDPQIDTLDVNALAGVQVVIHLAGSSIAERWSDEVKRTIRESRLRSTRLLVDTMARMAVKPDVFLCASAVGFYGDTGEETADEESSSGRGFLADLCQMWEAEAWRAREHEIRVVALRFGAILARDAGLLGKMVPHFQMGMGGALGSGQQWMSWITIDDAVRAIWHAISNTVIDGPVNVVSPRPVRNGEFTSVLALALGRPSMFAVPAFALKMRFGEMAEETMLANSRVLPRRLTQTDFEFNHAMIDGALEHVLKAAKAETG